MIIAEVIFNDSKSSRNKDLIQFIKRNIEGIIMRAKIKFRFRINRAEDLPKYRQRGITKFPAMIIENKSYVDTRNIIDHLSIRIKRSKDIAPMKTEDEILREFQMKEMGSESAERDGDGKILVDRLDQEELSEDDVGSKLSAAANREAERRKINISESKRPAARQLEIRPTDRHAEQDDNFDNRMPTIERNTNTRGRRRDNVDEDASRAGSAEAATKALIQRGNGGDDDSLMLALLDKIGGD